MTIDAPLSRGRDLHMRDPIKSVDKARGQCNILAISAFPWSIAARFPCHFQHCHGESAVR